jgi:hypothetical protein
VRREDVDRAGDLLAADGWVRHPEPGVELTTGQRHYSKPLGRSASLEHLDLHWRIVNPLIAESALPFAELRARADALPPLGPSARTLSPADALLVACVHRVAHHANDPAAPALLWLMDIRLLVERLDAAGRERFPALAEGTSLAAVCRDGLDAAAAAFDSGHCARLSSALARSAREEPTERLLHSASPFARMRADLATLPTWRARAALVREHLFPPTAWLRARYPRCPALLLPLAALYRIAAGAPSWLKRNR